MKFGPPSEWSGTVAALAGPERRQRMKFEWEHMTPAERHDVERRWHHGPLGEALLQLYIEALVEDVSRVLDGQQDVDEASGAGGVVGAPGGGPGWVSPKGFALRSSKRQGAMRRKTAT